MKMAQAQLKKSEKLHLIDQATFEKIQQQSNTSHIPNKPIQNSKYKKTRCSFNLLNFVKKPKTAAERLKQKAMRRRPSNLKVPALKKRRGKTREGGRKKKHSRLKKAILRYRLQKQQLQLQTMNEVTQNLEDLKIESQTEEETKALASISKVPSGFHSRRFRSYCDNCTIPALAELTERLLRELDRFQKRAYAQNEVKARSHRRLVVGFREIQNFLHIKKVRLVIIAPDCEQSKGEAGLDEEISNIKQQCQNQNIPYAFSLRRRQLAYALYKKVPVSCVGILNYDGAREIFAQLLDALQEAKQRYIETTTTATLSLSDPTNLND